MTKLALLDYEPIKIEMECNTEIEARLRVTACQKEPWTRQWLDAMPEGSVLYDVGANVGGYTLIAAARGHQVVAFEPILTNAETLRRNCCNNLLEPRVIIHALALGNQNGYVWVGWPAAGMSSGAANHLYGTDEDMYRNRADLWHQQRVPCERLDDLVSRLHPPAPTHLKLDVEGAELVVLEGAEQLLTGRTLRSLMIELQPSTEPSITAWLAQRGWTMVQQWHARGISYGQYEWMTGDQASGAVD
jgi:FkbM family methyltransferase